MNLLSIILRAAAWLLTVLYTIALIIFIVGTIGLFGFEKDPLSGVYLIVLGWPWPILTENLPESLLPVSAIASPLINILLLQFLGLWFSKMRHR